MSRQTETPLLSQTNLHLGQIREHLEEGLVGPGLEGVVPFQTLSGVVMEKSLGGLSIMELRVRFRRHLTIAGEFPAYCDVGLQYFKEVYDWHVRHKQPINMTRDAQNRMVIQFMFTQLVLRSDMDELYCGEPYDK